MNAQAEIRRAFPSFHVGQFGHVPGLARFAFDR